MSTQIKNLEKELDTRLFIRTTKELFITEKGKILYSYSKKILELEENAIEKIIPKKNKRISIGASTIPSSKILPNLIKKFIDKNKDTSFNILQGDSSEIISRILDGTCDIGFVGSKSDNNLIFCEEFAEDELVIAMPNNHYFRNMKKNKASLDKLLDNPLISREKGSGTLKSIELYLEEKNIDIKNLNILVRTNDMKAIISMVKLGIGISILPKCEIVDEITKEDSKLLIFPLEDCTRKFYYIYLKNNNFGDETIKFLDMLQKNKCSKMDFSTRG